MSTPTPKNRAILSDKGSQAPVTKSTKAEKKAEEKKEKSEEETAGGTSVPGTVIEMEGVPGPGIQMPPPTGVEPLPPVAVAPDARRVKQIIQEGLEADFNCARIEALILSEFPQADVDALVPQITEAAKLFYAANEERPLRVRVVRQPVGENGVAYHAGEIFETSPERRRALGSLVVDVD